MKYIYDLISYGVHQTPYASIIMASLIVLTYLVFVNPIGTLCIVAMHQQLNLKLQYSNRGNSHFNKYAGVFFATLNTLLYVFSYLHPVIRLMCITTMGVSCLYYSYMSQKPFLQYQYFNLIDMLATGVVLASFLPYLSVVPIVIHLFTNDLAINSTLVALTLSIYCTAHKNELNSYLNAFITYPAVSNFLSQKTAQAFVFLSYMMQASQQQQNHGDYPYNSTFYNTHTRR